VEINSKEEELTKVVDEITGGVNINSPKQLTEYLYNTLKLPKQYDRKTGRLSSGKDIVEKLSIKYGKPELRKILELRNLRKLKSTYVDIKMDKDNRMRTSYGLTVSGRLSSRKNIFGSGMNLQNIPPSSRKIFVPDEGKMLIAADLAQAEAMAVAWESRDEGLKDVFRGGGDIHSSIAKLVFAREDITKEQRSLAKRVVHGTNYCMGINTLALFCEIPVAQAKVVQAEYFKLFPMVKAWHHEIEGTLNKSRQLMTSMGRKRTFFGRWGDPIKREAISYIPQSTVAINSGTR
jgi:DNA polymerase-1